MFGISGEHLLVLLVILLVFGPKRLPDLGNSLGRTLRNFKDAMAGNDRDTAANTILPAQPVQATPAVTQAPAQQASTQAASPEAVPVATPAQQAEAPRTQV